METIQVVLDSKLLRATDGAARRARVNRSALIRDALREHLRRIEIREMEEREREAYRRHPDDPKEVEAWEREAVWPQK
jgi:metal-responsive CopG/Arc/MetJ family transcriptional regulator